MPKNVDNHQTCHFSQFVVYQEEEPSTVGSWILPLLVKDGVWSHEKNRGIFTNMKQNFTLESIMGDTFRRKKARNDDFRMKFISISQ